MAENRQSHETDVARLLAGHYEEAPMDDAFRLTLQDRTRRLVAARRKARSRRWVFGLAAAAVVVIAVLVGHLVSRPPVIVKKVPGVTHQPQVVRTPAAGFQQHKVAPQATVRSVSDTPEPRRSNKGSAPAVVPTPTPAAEPLVAVITARGPVTDQAGRPLKVGDRLAAGAAARTGPAGRVTLVFRRGSEFTLNARSELAFVSAGVATLRNGEVYCRSRAGEIKRIDTIAGRIHLLGTILDAATQNHHAVAVTVVRGEVRLANAHGEAIVPAGRRALLVASRPPEAGAAVTSSADIAWYASRATVVSDFGDIAYRVRWRDSPVSEVWTMKADGTHRRRLKTYLGDAQELRWLPGQRWLLMSTQGQCWTRPDFKHHTAVATGGAFRHVFDILNEEAKDRLWLLDAATGQDRPFFLPRGYTYKADTCLTVSPDGRRLAIFGAYSPDAEGVRESERGGLRICDLQTGSLITRFGDLKVRGGVGWAPDNRRLVASTGEEKAPKHPLVLVDTDTGEVTDLGLDGTYPEFSPEGGRLAYVSDLGTDPDKTQGSVLVVELSGGAAPRRISRAGQGAVAPSWSPDGTRVLYGVVRVEVPHKDFDDLMAAMQATRIDLSFLVAAVDGSGAQEVYKADFKTLWGASWAQDGKAIYVIAGSGVQLVSPDGSGILRNLGGTERDSVLPRAKAVHTRRAAADINEAIFQYALANIREYEGRVAEGKKAFSAAADLFAALPWKYPLADLSADDVLAYADRAAEMAKRPVQDVLQDTCAVRFALLWLLLDEQIEQRQRFPSDLGALEKQALSHPPGPIVVGMSGWIQEHDTEWIKMVFRCPSGEASGRPIPYVYTLPGRGQVPKVGDVLLSCPRHPECRILWNEDLVRKFEQWRKRATQPAPGEKATK